MVRTWMEKGSKHQKLHGLRVPTSKKWYSTAQENVVDCSAMFLRRSDWSSAYYPHVSCNPAGHSGGGQVPLANVPATTHRLKKPRRWSQSLKRCEVLKGSRRIAARFEGLGFTQSLQHGFLTLKRAERIACIIRSTRELGLTVPERLVELTTSCEFIRYECESNRSVFGQVGIASPFALWNVLNAADTANCVVASGLFSNQLRGYGSVWCTPSRR